MARNFLGRSFLIGIQVVWKIGIYYVYIYIYTVPEARQISRYLNVGLPVFVMWKQKIKKSYIPIYKW